MTFLRIILYTALAMAVLLVLSVIVWLAYTAILNRLERRLAARKGPYRDLVAGLATRERELLDPAIRQLGTLRDFEALEAVLEEQARTTTERPAWLLDAYDRLGLVDKYIERLRNARRWRDRAFAAELLGRVGNAKAVTPLLDTVAATRAEDADVREIALRALARIADPRAVEPLVQALRSSEVWLTPRLADILARHGEDAVAPMLGLLDEGGRHHARAWAASVLGEVRAYRGFPVLIRALGDPDDEVRAKASGALGKLGDRRAIPYLLDHLLTDPAPFVRARIAGALGQFDDPDVIERLVRALGDPAWWVRMRSVEALEQIGPQSEAPLLVALDDPDPELRIRAAVALERLGVPGRTVRMIEEGDRPEQAREVLSKFANAGARELIAELLLHPAAAVRLAVVAAVRRTGRRDLSRELIRAAVEDSDATVRASAFDTLRVLNHRGAVPSALTGLADPDDSVRTEAISLLGDLGTSAVIPDVRTRTTDPEAGVRAAAARALGLLRGTDAAPDLARLLTDPSPAVRVAAAEGIADSGLSALAPSVTECLGDSDDRVRLTAARALARLGDASQVPALLRAFTGASPEFRAAITTAVAVLAPTQLETLAQSLRSEGAGPDERLAFARALSEAPVAGARGVLAQLARDPEAEVRARAIAAIGRLGGTDADELVREALADPADVVRTAALTAVIRLRNHELSPEIRSLLAQDPSSSVRERAALAAGLLDLADTEPQLVQAMAPASEPSLRAAALLALGALGHESMVGRLGEMPDGDDVRQVLQERLRHDPEYRLLGRRLRQSHSLELRALASLSRDEMQQQLSEGVRSVLDPSERKRVVAGLRAFQGDRSRSALLQTLRSDPSPDVRAAAMAAVRDMLEPAELLVTARRALGDPSLVVRRAAVELFRDVPAPEALAALIATVRTDDDPSVLRSVAEQAEQAWDTFIDLALGSGAGGREAVVVTQVARHMTHPGVASLVPPLARSAEPEVRAGVAQLLVQRPELGTEPIIQQLILDPVPAVRLQAAHAAAMAGLGVQLGALADDPEPEVRRELAQLLRTVPDGGALARLLADSDARVRAAAAVSAISRGERTDLPGDVAAEDAAAAVMDANHLADLREIALTSPEERHRRSAALLLALVGDQVAARVAAGDPVATVRAAVTAMQDRIR
jgi:HEAT repeat protein